MNLKKNMIGIYKIQSPNNRVYIGQSWDIKRRWKDHKSTKAYKLRKLHASFMKYGVENHSFELLHELPKDINQKVLNTYEQLYMDLYRNCNIDLLNIKEGGNGFGKHSEETKSIIREKRKFQICTDETRRKISNHFKTIKRNPEWVKKVADASRNRKVSIETRQKIMRKINQYTKEGIFINEWDSLTSASEYYKCNISNIANCLTNRAKTACGYIWKYKH